MRRVMRVVLLAAPIFVTGCAAPYYDEQTDKLVTQLQTDVETQFTTLITSGEEISFLSGQSDAASKVDLAKYQAQAGWNANIAAYDKIEVDLLLLRPRVEAVQSWAGDRISQQLDLLGENLIGPTDSLRSTHQREGILRLDTLQGFNGLVTPELNTLVATEVQLKAGQGSANTSTGSKSGS